MKITILTQYFPPEVGAPQNRLYEMAVRLQKLGVEIEVLTAMPNYPSMEIHNGYKGKWYVNETMDGMNIHRAWIWVGKSKSIIPRLMNFWPAGKLSDNSYFELDAPINTPLAASSAVCRQLRNTAVW